MANKYLYGNGETCPACILRRRKGSSGLVHCNHCGGRGRKALPKSQIIAAQVAEARIFHWGIDPVPCGGGAV